MKWLIGFSAAAAVAILAGANWVRRDLQEKTADAAFQGDVRKGEKVYREACGACHAIYDPRFYAFDEWARVLAGRGCPAVHVELDAVKRKGIENFLRAKAAPTAEEADLTRQRERSRSLGERGSRGREVFAKRCAACHPHAFYAKTRTAREWAETLADLGGLHRSVKEPVWLEEKPAAELLEFLGSAAAGTPSDAAAIRALIASGSGANPAQPPAAAGEEIPWIRDLEAGLKEARDRAVPLIVDFTDLSGG
jgi:mono/diheme cytochrome c family protein